MYVSLRTVGVGERCTYEMKEVFMVQTLVSHPGQLTRPRLISSDTLVCLPNVQSQSSSAEEVFKLLFEHQCSMQITFTTPFHIR